MSIEGSEIPRLENTRQPKTDFERKKTKFFSDFATMHMTEMRILLEEGHLLRKFKWLKDVMTETDPKAKGWKNVAEHNLLAGVMADKIGKLVGLEDDERTELVSVAATHDWDKRREKESRKTGEKDGFIKYDVKKEIEAETNKGEGLVRVTGSDWSDFDTWGMPEKILRYVDSSLGQTPDNHADIVPWEARLEELGRRHKEVNETQGNQMYGMLLYDKLAEITRRIEIDIYNAIIGKHPELQKEYTQPVDLSQLIRDQIEQDIKNTPLSTSPTPSNESE
jgi:hypothetical protein